MNDLDAFVAETVPQHTAATTAVRHGDASALIEMLSPHDPVRPFLASQPIKYGPVTHRHGDPGPGGDAGVDHLRAAMSG
jgi:hypothetical protein